MTTKPTDTASERSTSRSEARSVGVRSITMPMSMAGEIEARRCGISAFTLFTASTMLAPGCLNSCNRMAGLPMDVP